MLLFFLFLHKTEILSQNPIKKTPAHLFVLELPGTTQHGAAGFRGGSWELCFVFVRGHGTESIGGGATEQQHQPAAPGPARAGGDELVSPDRGGLPLQAERPRGDRQEDPGGAAELPDGVFVLTKSTMEKNVQKRGNEGARAVLTGCLEPGPLKCYGPLWLRALDVCHGTCVTQLVWNKGLGSDCRRAEWLRLGA